MSPLPRSLRPWLLLLLLLAAGLRFHALFANSFHSDEALFASWARLIAVWRDPLLQSQPVDKPPLLFYLQALFYPLLATPAPWVARLPNLAASLLLLPLTAQLVWQLYGQWLPALLAAIFVALSPFAVQFSATAFTDPLLTALLLASLVAVSGGAGQEEGRYAPAAGVLFGLAVATKHQAWLFLPLLVGLGLLLGWRGRAWRRWLAGFLPLLLLLLLWQGARGGGLSLWSQQVSNVGGLRLIWSWELWPRLEAWSALGQYLLGSPLLAFLLLLGLPVFLALLIAEQTWSSALDQLFLIFVAGYGLLHWLLAVPVWDRYLLPLLPLLALLLGRFLARLVGFVRPALAELPPMQETLGPAAAALLFLLLLPPGLAARAGAFPVGGQPQADDGAAEVAAFLGGAPYGTVLYDHWYSWQWRYYLFDSGVYVNWFPHPAALLEDLAVFGRGKGQRYLALPRTEAALPVERAMREAGFRLEAVYNARAMSLYRIIPAPP